MVWTAALTTLLASLPQEPDPEPETAPAVLVERPGATVPVDALGLGTGGLDPDCPRLEADAPGQYVTRGGIRVQARKPGVKLDFPGGAELLFTRTGFLHLRSGEQDGRYRRGLALHLADGSEVRVELSARSGGRVEEVDIVENGTTWRVWHRDEPTWERPRTAVHRGVRMLVAGRGETVYAFGARGPVLFLERRLAPAGRTGHLPEHQVIVDATPLKLSLHRLAKRHSSPHGEFHDVDELTRALSARARGIFPPGRTELDLTERDELRVGSGGGFELSFDGKGSGPLIVGLHGGHPGQPVLEWVIDRRCRIELLRPDASDEPGRRYHGRGIDLRSPERWPFPSRRGREEARFCNDVITALLDRGERRASSH